MKQHNGQPATTFVLNQAAVATVKREVVTPNVRKTPTIVIGGQGRGGMLRSFKVRDSRGTVGSITREDRAGVRDEMMEGINTLVTPCQPEVYKLDPHPFVVPVGPTSIKKRKPNNSLPQEDKRIWFSKGESVNKASVNCRARRYLTPQTNGSLKLMFLQSNRKVTQET